MNLKDMIKWSISYCKQRLFESILIILGIGLGVGVIVSVLAIFEGVRIQQASFLEQEQYRTIRIRTVQDLREIFSESEGPLISVPDIIDAQQLSFTFEDLDNLKTSFPRNYVFLQRNLRYPLQTEENIDEEDRWSFILNRIQLTACSLDFFQFRNLKIAKGDFFLEQDIINENKVIILGNDLAKQLFDGEDPIEQTIYIGMEGDPYTVVGVLTPIEDRVGSSVTAGSMQGNYNQQAFIPITAQPTMPNIMRRGQSNNSSEINFNEIFIGLPLEANIGSNLEAISDYVFYTYGDTVSVSSPYTSFLTEQRRFLFMGMVVLLFASVGMIIAAVNILNLMLARIIKRIHSIGLSKAIGASRKKVFQQFLVEAGLLGTIGAIFGIVFSFVGVKVISYIVDQPIANTPLIQLAGIIIALLTSLIFGVYPAIQAAKVNPVDALRKD